MKKSVDSCTPILENFTDIKTPYGIGKYNGIKITELGYVMVRVYFPDEKIFKNYVVKTVEELLSGSKLEICQ